MAHRRTVVVTGVVLLAALETNQQAHADLLRSGPGTGPSAWELMAISLPLAGALCSWPCCWSGGPAASDRPVRAMRAPIGSRTSDPHA